MKKRKLSIISCLYCHAMVLITRFHVDMEGGVVAIFLLKTCLPRLVHRHAEEIRRSFKLFNSLKLFVQNLFNQISINFLSA